MAGLVAKDPHAPLVFAPLDFEHLRFLELLEARMREIERNRNGRGAVGCEPLVGEIEMQRKAEASLAKLLAKLIDPLGQRAFNRQGQVSHTQIEQSVIVELRPSLVHGAFGHVGLDID